GGEIGDEQAGDIAQGVVGQSDGSFLADARASLEDVTAIVDEFDVGDVAKDVDTLAGYVATRIGRVPVRGELVPGPGPFELEILDADPRRVKKLRIYRSLDRQNGNRPVMRRQLGPAPAPPSAPASPPPATRDEADKLSPDPVPSKSAHPPRRSLASAIPSYSPGAGGAFWAPSPPARLRRWRCRPRTFGRCPSLRFRFWSGALTARPAAASVECSRPPRSAGGLVSAISSPGSIGLAMRSWSTPRL